jgi:hypothetical protein
MNARMPTVQGNSLVALQLETRQVWVKIEWFEAMSLIMDYMIDVILEIGNWGGDVKQ